MTGPGSGAPPSALTKDEARAKGRAARRAVTAALRKEAAHRLERGLLRHPLVAALEPGPVLVPATHGDEMPTEPVARALEGAGWTLVRPRSEPADFRIVPVPWPSDNPLVPAYAGVPEPPRDAPSLPADALRLILVPGLAFAEDGARVGTGAGFFDRFLAPLVRRAHGPVVIGVGYRAQLVAGIRVEPHDVAMDGLQLEDVSRVCRAPA